MNEPSRSPRGVVIVAGGRSTRMGQDKAWLRIDDECLLQRIVRLARRASGWVVVAASPGQDLPPVDALRVDDALEHVGKGPVGGILAGLEALLRTGVELAVVTSVDCVRSRPEHFVYLFDRLAHEGHAAVVPVTPQERGTIVHGLCGAVRVRPAIAVARTLLSTSEGPPVRRLYEHLGAQHLDAGDLPDPSVVRGCNTPEQWYEALAELTSDA